MRETRGIFPVEILTRLRCPQCGDPVRLDGDGLHGEGLHGDGFHGDGMVCGQGHELEVRDRYVDASREATDPLTRRTLASFGYEWTTFDRVQEEDEAFSRDYLRDLPLEEIGEMVALDAGCGKGRYSHFLAPHVRALAALDGSDAVEAAVGNLSGHENVAVVRADLFDAPFAAESFGLVVCFGVLHHLAQPRAGLAKLASLLQPGGLLCVYLYSRPSRRGVRWAALSAARVVRRLVAPLPLPVVRVLSAPIAGALYAMVVWPGDMGDRRKSRLLSGLPLASYRGKPVRSLWLDTFDRLSAPIEHRFVWAEIAPWFEELGLAVESVRDQYGLFILARRAPAGPAAGAAPPAPASA